MRFGISNQERTTPPHAMGKQETKPRTNRKSCATTTKIDYALTAVSSETKGMKPEGVKWK